MRNWHKIHDYNKQIKENASTYQPVKERNPDRLEVIADFLYEFQIYEDRESDKNDSHLHKSCLTQFGIWDNN